MTAAGRVLAGLVASNAEERWWGVAMFAVAIAYTVAGVLVERHIARRRLARMDATRDAAHTERLRLARVNAARRELDDAARDAAELAPCTCPNGCARHPYSVLRSVPRGVRGVRQRPVVLNPSAIGNPDETPQVWLGDDWQAAARRLGGPA